MGDYSRLASILGTIPLTSPEWPAKWSSAYVTRVEERLDRRVKNLPDQISASGLGRIIPEPTQIRIGSGKQLHLAVLFLDICQFSSWPSSNHAEQSAVLTKLNVFMAEMLNIISDYEGCYEKNTGDGLMAYFGATNSELTDSSRTAAHCATVMHAVNDYVLTPWFTQQGLTPVKFRVGIDSGQLTIARVGIPNLAEQRVAIGSHANIACKIMRFAPDGGICIGNNVKNHLTANWQNALTELPDTGFIYTQTNLPYKAFKLNYKPPYPVF